MAKHRPACLIIMDGFGLAEAGPGNAISLARTPRLDALFAERPWTKLQASEEAVGLPEGQMGNSEVGHLNIGAGRVVYQELTRINRACRTGELESNPVIASAFEAAAKPGAVLHLMGLLSDGGVHSSNEHLYALIEAAAKAGVRAIRVHCFLDGRDVPPASGAGYVAQLLDVLGRVNNASDGAVDARIGSIEGRYYAMDRDNRWERVEQAYNTVALGENLVAEDAVAAVESSYAQGVTDEFVVPVALDGRGMRDGDAVIFFNFRPDRARELTRALVDAFAKEFPEDVLADVLASAGLSQYHIAETEKYAHVTFFLNGGREEPKAGEQRVLVPSPKVATYDMQPSMSQPEVAATLAVAIENDEADVYIVNFANCDMVGHTGSIPAAVEAVEAVDAGVGAVVDAIVAKGGVAFVTADHGNADKMLAADGSPHTAHTTALVPFVLVDATGEGRTLSPETGALCDIAPTLLEAIGVEKPSAMTGRSLLQ